MDTFSIIRKHVVVAVASMLALSVGHAAGPSDASVEASALSAASAGLTASVVVTGSIEVLALSGRAVVASVEAVEGGCVLVLHGASDAGSATIRIVGMSAEEAGRLVGGVVMISAATTGYVLRNAGRIIAFVPDTVGTALLHSARVADYR